MIHDGLRFEKLRSVRMRDMLELEKLIYLLFLGLVLLFGGLGVGWEFLVGLGGLFVVVAWMGKFEWKKLKGSSLWFLLVLVVGMFLSELWGAGEEMSFRWSWYFLVGLGFYGVGLFWEVEEKWIERLVVVLGGLWGLVYLGGMFLDIEVLKPVDYRNLVAWVSENHLHLGDWFVLVGLVGLKKILEKRDWWGWLLSILGLGVVLLSESRSAYLAFLVGALMLLKKDEKMKWVRWILVTTVVVGFGVVAREKSMVLSRLPYYFGALLSLKENPLGVGMGRFQSVLSEFYWDLPWYLQGAASDAHGLLFEVMVGVGWLGVLGLVGWLVGFFSKAKKRGMLWVMWVVMMVNVMFDNTYLIGGFWWLLMLLSGILEKNKNPHD